MRFIHLLGYMVEMKDPTTTTGISEEDWCCAVPGEHQLLDNFGIRWDILRETHSGPFGWMEFVVQDPDGNELRVSLGNVTEDGPLQIVDEDLDPVPQFNGPNSRIVNCE